MGQVVTIGLDIAKSVFQVHGVDESGVVIVRRQVRRAQLVTFFAKLPACLVGIEACATAHHWDRELIKLGHQVRLMPPSYVFTSTKRMVGRVTASQILGCAGIGHDPAVHLKDLLVDKRELPGQHAKAGPKAPQ